MTWWRQYWFASAPCLDLAAVRIAAVFTQLFILFIFYDIPNYMEEMSNLPSDYYEPLPTFLLLHVPLAWSTQPDLTLALAVWYVAGIAGVLALVGLFTNASMLVFAAASAYVHAFNYSFGDFHHPEAVMVVALGALAVSPCGRVLSVDWWLARRRRQDPQAQLDPVEVTSVFAGWPIRLIQWFFVLMYLSAVWNKLGTSGLDWANGYTLQYYLAEDGLRWDSALGTYMAQHHIPVLLGQYVTLLFQATFALPVLFPKLRWLYVPLGLFFHITIYLTLTAPFFQWIALYAVFIPWSEALNLFRARFGDARRPVAGTG
jgi:Vitamin K-dependent gamma-carboxylase